MSQTVTNASKLEEDRPISETVVKAVAERENVDPLDLDQRLYEAIDPDALDSLFSPAGGVATDRITFTFCGHEVRVDRDGTVSLNP